MTEARILVVGGYTIGEVTAARLAGAGRQVSMLDADEEHVKPTREPKLLLDDFSIDRRVRLDAYTDGSGDDTKRAGTS